jgi:myosin heavy subunit
MGERKRGDVELGENDLLTLHDDSLADYADMVKMDDLNEPVILHNLQQRYQRDLIYVRVNPFSLVSVSY